MSNNGKSATTRPSAKLLSHGVLTIAVKVIDRSVPDALLRGYLILLDRHVPPKVIATVVVSLWRYVPNKFLASAIVAADEYVPDSVANSRKVCAVLAGLGKYVPDRAVPPGSADRWDNIKLRFHVPTLVARGQSEHSAKDSFGHP
jgi:hypothetical protein